VFLWFLVACFPVFVAAICVNCLQKVSKNIFLLWLCFLRVKIDIVTPLWTIFVTVLQKSVCFLLYTSFFSLFFLILKVIKGSIIMNWSDEVRSFVNFCYIQKNSVLLQKNDLIKILFKRGMRKKESGLEIWSQVYITFFDRMPIMLTNRQYANKSAIILFNK
jgi:hypothetical protein